MKLENSKPMKIILDNGHGIETPGKRSPVWLDGSQMFEYEFNRAITSRIYSAVILLGIDCVMLVPEIWDVPLEERTKRANKIHRLYGNSLTISVHGNAGGGKGFEVYTYTGQSMSDVYATEFFNEADKTLDMVMRSDWSDNDPDKEAKFWMLRKTIGHSLLTENGFMDTETDCRYMMSEQGRDEIAKFHINAILNVLS